jgi:3-methyladenine DNA glycosylase AlkD
MTQAKASTAKTGTSANDFTAKKFIEQLSLKTSKAEYEKVQRFFRGNDNSQNEFLGVRMGELFKLAKAFENMPLKEIDKLLDNNFYEVRMGAVCIMDFQARHKKITPEKRKELFDLYIKRHDRINNWDMVDRSAPHVVGAYLADRPRTVLYKLAKSKNVWERRTAIVSTWFFIRQGDNNDTFRIAELLVKDKHDLIHKAVGGWIREAGKRDKPRLLAFLDKYAATMPRVMLRYSVEKLDKKQKEYYMASSNQT